MSDEGGQGLVMGVSQIDGTLAALADPQRRRALELLHEGPMPAGELSRAVGIAPPAMSRHLKVLRASGLVEEFHPESDARVRIYTLRPGPMVELEAWLSRMQAAWGGQMESFKAHVEGSRSRTEAR